MVRANATNDLANHAVSYRERPAINFGRIGALTKPTVVILGTYSLLSLPVYASDNEEIFFNHSIVRRWDGVSNLTVGCMASIDTAISGGGAKNFRLQLSWEHYASGAVVPVTSNDVNFDQAVADPSAQYKTYPVTWTVDYDVDGAGNELKAGEVMGGRIRRIAAASAEYGGEVMLHGFYIQYTRDKLGTSV